MESVGKAVPRVAQGTDSVSLDSDGLLAPALESGETIQKLVRAMNTGFVPLRRGLLEHVQQGRLSKDDFCAFVFMLADCDHKTGVWWGCGEKLCICFPGMEKRRSQESLKHLEEIGFIRRYMKGGAARGNYPILINKFPLPDGSLTDAARSDEWKNVVTVRPKDTKQNAKPATSTRQRAVQNAPIQEVEVEPAEEVELLERERVEDTDENNAATETEGEYKGVDLRLEQSLREWMRDAAGQMGKKWKHGGKTGKGPTPQMLTLLREKETLFGKTRFRRWWVDYLAAGVGDEERFPYSPFLNGYINSRSEEAFVEQDAAAREAARKEKELNQGMFGEDLK
jgi:hypothetical protein